jgi:hypothetical protein
MSLGKVTQIAHGSEQLANLVKRQVHVHILLLLKDGLAMDDCCNLITSSTRFATHK